MDFVLVEREIYNKIWLIKNKIVTLIGNMGKTFLATEMETTTDDALVNVVGNSSKIYIIDDYAINNRFYHDFFFSNFDICVFFRKKSNDNIS